MSYIPDTIRQEFEGYRTTGGATDAVRALDEIDQRHHEVAEMLVLARVTLLHGQACDREMLSSHLYATLALLAMIAEPFDVVHAELQRLRQIAATVDPQAGAGEPARS